MQALHPNAAPRPMQRFELAAIAPQPWLNGAGLTQEIACGRLAGTPPEAWDWRLSLALITADGPFSRFAGVARTAMLAEGALRLRTGTRTLRWQRPGEVHAFAGEAGGQARLVHAPARLLNLMVREGRLHGSLQARSRDGSLPACEALWHGLLVLEGAWSLTSPAQGQELAAGQGVWGAGPRPALRLLRRSPTGHVALLRIAPARVPG